MRILVVAATEDELAAAAVTSAYTVDRLVTGVGMVATAVRVARALAATPYDLALNVGVCGALDRSLPLTSVVHVVSDALPELGVEDGSRFISADAAGLVGANEPPWTDGRLVNASPAVLPGLEALPVVSGITVNTVHGEPASIAAVKARTAAQVESMEGAAFLFACLTAGVPCAQVRAVSNYVERRNRAAWRLADALAALRATTSRLLAP